jgi:tetratricopeptide (TPR) repeat protein
MPLRGDLSTLELVDIVQNLEMHRKSGVLAVETPRGARQLCVENGAVCMYAAPGRPTLMEDLVRAGLVRPADIESARKRRWRSRKSLGEWLVKLRAVEQQELNEFASCRLREDLCDFLALDSGAFTFSEGKPPRDVFDPEERALGLALPIGASLFEAAKRMDHMPAIRSLVPADSAHFHAHSRTLPPGEKDTALATAVLRRLDGTRNVRQLMQGFPHRRFEVYEMLARLAQAQAIRSFGADDMASLVQKLSNKDSDLAWQVVQDGLAANGHHMGLLREKATLASARREPKAAAEAHKLIAHMQLESGDRSAALVELMRASELDPEDTSVLERTLALAVEDERLEDAFEQGFRLVKLYRLPGLHSKAVAVLESLVRLDPEHWTIQRELAHSRADCGNIADALGGLERYGKKLLARGDYKAARAVQIEILKISPSRKQAQKTIEMIDAQVYERRRALRRRLLQRALLVLIAGGLGALIYLDTRARLDLARAEQEIGQRNLIEQGEYAEAVRLLEVVRAEHPYTLTAMLELRSRLADLRAKHAAQDQPAPEPEPEIPASE